MEIPCAHTVASGQPRTSPVLARKARLPAFVGLQRNPDAALDAFHPLLVGVGSVGAQAALALAALQAGSMFMIDPGRWKLQSLQTSPCLPADIGRLKAVAVGQQCHELSPGTHLRIAARPIEDFTVFDTRSANIVLLATDGPAAEIAAAALRIANRPLIHAAIDGPTLTIYLRIFPNRSPDDPCPGCSFSPREWEETTQGYHRGCDGSGKAIPGRVIPTMSLRALCSMAGDLLAMLAIQWQLGLRKLEPSIIEYSLSQPRITVSPLKRHPDCHGPHTTTSLVTLADPLDSHHLIELLSLAGGLAPQDYPSLLLEIDARQGPRTTLCSACREVFFGSPKTNGGAAATLRCVACGSLPLERVRTGPGVQLPIADLLRWADVPLAGLGGAGARWLTVKRQERAVLLSAAPRNS